MFSNSINIYLNDNQKSIKLKNKLSIYFSKMKISINEKSSNIIVIGGDGTFIKVFSKCGMKNVKLLLINTGCIGFYSSFNANFLINEILNFFHNEKNFYCPDIIKCEINAKKYYGINEVFINSSGALITNISINKNKYESFFGSGLCFSTITGSTGLNKSLGGSIFLTRKRLWQMVEVAPINNVKNLTITNSIILDKKNYIILNNVNSKQINISYDGINQIISNCKCIKLSLVTAKAKIAIKNLKQHISKLCNIFIKS